jgi:uncharacterized OsmC-like protein
VLAGDGNGEARRVGIHRAVGGFHDLPNPGDLLCAALAACFDTTLRMLAARFRVPIERLSVQVTGNVDVRGTLAVDRGVQVGFQSLDCRVDLETADGATPEAVERLLAGAERACVVLQTLRHGVPVNLVPAGPETVEAAAEAIGLRGA